jgi:hypothetical protein
MRPSELLDDFTKRRGYGSIEFEFRDGVIVFVRRKETFITAQEKNSAAVPRGEHGTHNRDTNQTY